MGVVLEIVEPRESVGDVYRAPVVSITVADVGRARRELEERHVTFVSPVFDTATECGAYAIINVRFTTSYIRSSASEILVFGDAVVVEKS